MAMVPCKECGQSISDAAMACPRCGAPGPRAMTAMGYELRVPEDSQFPLVHIAIGFDPRTGRKRIAKGIVAIGDVAVGGLAIGGVALGVLSLGGLSVGLVALGGAAIGALLGLGGLAVGTVAIGGLAIGYYAMGGGAFGAHVVSSWAQDPEAVRFFSRFGRG